MGAATAAATSLISINAVEIFVASAGVLLRTVSIRLRRRPWKVHDFLCLSSLLCLIGIAVNNIYGAVKGGLGLDVDALLPANVTVALKTIFTSHILWATGTACFRLSILCLYIELFPVSAFFWCATATAAVVGLTFMATILMVCLSCRPIQFTWDRSLKGDCDLSHVSEPVLCALYVLLDIWVVCLPLPIVWRLQTSVQKKIGISTIFALGLIMAGINLCRIILTKTCGQDLHCVWPYTTLAGGEVAVGILVACVPTFGPVFHPQRFGHRAIVRRREDSRKDLLAARGRPPSRNLLTVSDATMSMSDQEPSRTQSDIDVSLTNTSESKQGSPVHAVELHTIGGL